MLAVGLYSWIAVLKYDPLVPGVEPTTVRIPAPEVIRTETAFELSEVVSQVDTFQCARTR